MRFAFKNQTPLTETSMCLLKRKPRPVGQEGSKEDLFLISSEEVAKIQPTVVWTVK